jgi:hypothetical protein
MMSRRALLVIDRGEALPVGVALHLVAELLLSLLRGSWSSTSRQVRTQRISGSLPIAALILSRAAA